MLKYAAHSGLQYSLLAIIVPFLAVSPGNAQRFSLVPETAPPEPALFNDIRLRSNGTDRGSRLTVLNPSNDSTVWGIVWQATRWDPGTRLRICFFTRLRQEKLLQHYETKIKYFPQKMRAHINRKKFASISRQLIRFYFRDGVARFIAAARSWERYGNISFTFQTGDRLHICGATAYHIRVSFDQPGHFSVMGTQSLPSRNPQVRYNQASLNIDLVEFAIRMAAQPWDEDRAAAERGKSKILRDFARTVRHEIGHAVSFDHEHVHPKSGCARDLKWAALYKIHGKAKIDANMRPMSLAEAKQKNVRYLRYDPLSVMKYEIPGKLLKSGTSSPCFTSVKNARLSEGDKTMMRTAYPQGPQAGTTFSRPAGVIAPAGLMRAYKRRIQRDASLTAAQRRAALAGMRRLLGK
jgi:hypothetical protein